MRLTLYTANAPQIGGPATWKPLIDSLGCDAIIIDPLDYVQAQSQRAAATEAIIQAAQQSDAIVAHGLGAAAAIEAADETGKPLVLISPILASGGWRHWILSTALDLPIVSGHILLIAQSRVHQWRNSAAALEHSITHYTKSGDVPDAILHEALDRVADPRADLVYERTIDTLTDLLQPVPERMLRHLKRERVIVGNTKLERRIFRKLEYVRRIIGEQYITALPNCGSLAMVEDPYSVGEIVRSALDSKPLATIA